ncbi:hypothetical protein [Gemella cuniculi]|uniref:hypothetical protein n=1 Tax=Gemella cuniculi TaxID=150240 RepID=UPI00040B340C|nr:hypothetical protein [Gemella cuniculi]
MKNNKLLKILWGVVFAIFLFSAIFLGVSYFNGKNTKETQSNKTQVSENKTTKTDEDKYKESSNSEKKEETKSSNATNSQSTDETKAGGNDNKTYEYNGKRLSPNESVGNTGKVFKSQKEAMEYGNSEIARLVKQDKKSRQFSVSKVTSEDNKLVGWTVDIYEVRNG